MKSLVVIYSLVIVSLFGFILYANWAINQLVARDSIQSFAPMVSDYTPLVIPDTGYNDATDALQTAAGTFPYQNANTELPLAAPVQSEATVFLQSAEVKLQ